MCKRVPYICLTFFLLLSLAAGCGGMEMGAQYGEAHEDSDSSQVLVSYKGESITQSMIDDKKALGDSRSDGEIMTQILIGMLLLEEAERRGLAATEAEIQEMVDMAKEAYTIPEGKELLDDYCTGAGITLEEYYELLRSQAPTIIAKQKLMDAIGQEYCQEKGIPFTKVNQPPEVQEAVDDYIAQLLETHQDEVEYFID